MILRNHQVIETKSVNRFPRNQTQKKKGKKMEAICWMLLKTNVEKMSDFRLSKMLMKTNDLYASFQDVDDKKGS
jgi:hypothetical protein